MVFKLTYPLNTQASPFSANSLSDASGPIEPDLYVSNGALSAS